MTDLKPALLDALKDVPAACATAFARQDAALTALGLRRVFAQDLYDDIAYAWRKSMRYRCVMQGDRLYQ